MKNSTLIIIAATLVFFTACHCKQVKKEYYIISKNDSIDDAHRHIKNFHGLELPPPPPPELPPEEKWFSNLVIVFDSSNKVYLYQTEGIENIVAVPQSVVDDTSKNGNSKTIYIIKNKNDQPNEANYYAPVFPYFIYLEPEFLLAFDDKTFPSFIKDNDDIFRFDTSFTKYNRYFTIASTKDTIKNPAFYYLWNLIKHKHKGYGEIQFNIRLTTEEENRVIECKSRQRDYNPYDYNWQGKYLDGKCKPLTDAYENLEKKCCYYRKAINTFKPKCTKMPRIE